MKYDVPESKSTLERFFYTPSAQAQAYLLCPYGVGRFTCEDNSRQWNPACDGYVFGYVLKGELTLLSVKGQPTLKAGTVFLLPADSEKHFGTSSSFDALWLQFGGKEADSLYHCIEERVGNPLKPQNPKRIKRLLKEIFNAVSQKKELPETELSLKIYALLMECATLPMKHRKKIKDYESSVHNAESYIRENLQMPLRVKDIARQVHMSPSHFSRVFKEETEMSPYEYVLSARLEAAKQYLTETNWSVEQIAFRIGFNSESNFIYFFTSNAGVSPNRFRKRSEMK